MPRLVKNGEIVLDGTLSKAEKEKMILEKFEHYEYVQELIEKVRIKGILLLAIDRRSEFSDVYYDFDDDKLVCVNHFESEERLEEWDNVATTLFLCDYGKLWREYRDEDGDKYYEWFY